MNTAQIRQAFFEYFQKHHHQVIPSSSLIPGNDPTLLFTNAGMVQFKETFLGLEPRPYTRAVTAQCCVRAGGKHNDLDNVGYTARHHTFFEMLGNFSFGDYFKRDAIQYAWEFLTKVLGLPPERLWITVFHEDKEAEDIWLNEMKVSSQRFSRCGEKDNFWSMGDTGPCGPCTEIFYDHGPEIAGGPPGSPEEDGDRYVEIWNLVFMQFNRDRHGKLHPLPKPSVDTGMGLERIAAVVQGVHNNYHIDLFTTLIESIIALKPDIDKNSNSLKVIADHIRSCCFLIKDGVTPSNEGRGYVLRRIIRRAIRHGNQLGLELPFFYRLVKPLIDVMGDAYPDLANSQTQLETVLKKEEEKFADTISQGLTLLKAELSQLSGKVIPGELAFKLYDTYGFPVDLTADIAREYQMTVDMAEFDACMTRQREQSQSASQFAIDYHDMPVIEQESAFHGYDADSIQAKITYLTKDNQPVLQLSEGESGLVVLDSTPFYAESGGQIGDQGTIESDEGVFEVEDTQKIGQAIVHQGKVLSGVLSMKDTVSARVNAQRRDAIRLNHTATHLVHEALKQCLGESVQQKGSLVNDTITRFDFSYHQALSPEQIQQVEDIVNEVIRANIPVATDVMSMDAAKKAGAVALFGEKYGDKVRVLSVGDYSKELCGGTHVNRTGDIGVFKIISEFGIASGIRRIEVVTGAYALGWLNSRLDMMQRIADTLKTGVGKVVAKTAQLVEDLKAANKEIADLKNKLAGQSSKDLVKEAVSIGTAQVLVKEMPELDSKGLRQLVDQLRSSMQNAVIMLYKIEDDKINVIAAVDKALIGGMPSAKELVQILCGKGGGRDELAQGGGPLPTDLNERLLQVDTMIKQKVSR
ncbi:alanine--tRNA ligase [Legionella sp. W05-934-2]|jgi:alanyl-tRNA synthetase|uniref:alanine--tRNA ligase n=1 Tax=Legionella sp. W05-934-2 TaxID=1198649 RepID=UPI003461F741